MLPTAVGVDRTDRGGEADKDDKDEDEDEDVAMSPTTSAAGASLASMLSGRALSGEPVEGPDPVGAGKEGDGEVNSRAHVGGASESSYSTPSRRGSSASLSSAVSGASQFSHPSRLHTPPGLPSVKTPERERVNLRVPILLFGNKLGALVWAAGNAVRSVPTRWRAPSIDRTVPESEYAEHIIFAAETLADSRPNVMFAFGR